MHKALLGLALFPALIIITLVIGLSCGADPSFAPFGSTVTILDPITGVSIPTNTVTEDTVEVLVTDPDGEPLNDVRVEFSCSFAGANDGFVNVDLDGDGNTDLRVHPIQLIDPKFEGVLVEDLPPEAFVDSPFKTTTDDRGVAKVVILFNGNVIIDTATFEASLGNGSVNSFDFSVNSEAVATIAVTANPDAIRGGDTSTIAAQTTNISSGTQICFDIPANSNPASTVSPNCDDTNTSGRARTTLTAGNVKGANQDIIVRACVDSNSSGTCDSGELADTTTVTICPAGAATCP